MEKAKTFKKIIEWIKNNRLSVIYFFFAIAIEMILVFTVEGNPFMTRPFVALGMLVMTTALVLYIPNLCVRVYTYTGLLALQMILDLIFCVVFDMTDQYFDLGMLKLRNDAFGIIETLPVNFFAFFGGLFFIIIYLVYGLRYVHGKRGGKRTKRTKWFYALAAVGGFAVTGVSLVCYFPRNSVDQYDEMINGRAESAYSAYGMIGNLTGEVYGAIFKDRTKLADSDIEKFIYEKTSTPTVQFGKLAGKNVVTVLAESLEWYAFLTDEEAVDDYPFSLPFSTKDMQALYPNLRQLYEESVVMTNFHSREKTDIAETISILGSYPTGAYINYEYSDNTLPHTVPNLLQTLRTESMSSKSFHNGFKTFYNRHKAHPILGFEGMTDMDDMEDIAEEWKDSGKEKGICFTDTMLEGTRNLDSEMFYTARDLIAPLDVSKNTGKEDPGVAYLDYAKGETFYSYITTITMHGMYIPRKNLLQEQEMLENYLRMIYTSGDYEIQREDLDEPYCYMSDEDEILFYYMLTALDTDKAIGQLKSDLAKKGLLEDTVIAVFGDHNAYYHELSNYVKDIEDYETDRKFTDLYNVPLMIYSKGWSDQMTDEERVINKFTCTADIVPTLLDLLGIEYYTNLYYGNSVFSDKQSVLYTRAYDNFISDGIVARSVNKVLYRDKSVTDAQFNAYKAEATMLVDKIKYCDYIFKQDYFGSEEKLALFQENMRQLNKE